MQQKWQNAADPTESDGIQKIYCDAFEAWKNAFSGKKYLMET